MKKVFILSLLLILTTISSFASEPNIIDLSKQKWEYKWGDSPFNNGIPIWTKDDSDSKQWKTIEYPTNPPNRDGKTNVWYRVKLPDTVVNDPHIYIFSIDLISEVYYKNKRIYNFGEFDDKGKGEYKGWPWHMFSIPTNSEGEYIYFRVYSHYLDIGLFGEILLSSKGDIWERMLDHDIPKLMVGAISVFVSILFIISFLLKLKRVELILLGFLFLTQGLNILCSVKILQIYLFYPLFQQYMLVISFFSFPIGMAMFMDLKIKQRTSFNIIKRIWQVHLAYLLASVSGALIGFYDIASTYEYFDILYYFITLPILTMYMIYYFFKGNMELKIITLSFFIISVYWLISFLIAYHILPWAEYPSDVAVFLCLLLLSYSIIKKLHYTSELEDEKEHLALLSSTDYLTKINNRKEIDKVLLNQKNIFKRYEDIFSIILLDIDDFKKINDTYGHLIGDKLLIEIASILNKNTRETDTVGRWGGEEFMVICPRTNEDEVLKLAESLRSKIENHNFEVIGSKTSSFGVSTYKKEGTIHSLVSHADDAMYISKASGKNRVSFK